MSPWEVAFRTYRAVRHPFDFASMRLGRYGQAPRELATWLGPRTFYFERSLVEKTLPTHLRERADLLCSGKREVLGLGWLDLPEPPWHVEPSRRERWPLVDSTRALGIGPRGFDARLTWEINRGHDWVVLARAWAATRDHRYRERLLDDLTSWTTHNPIGLGINWASAMEAAVRIHSLAWVAGFLRGQPLGDIAALLHVHATFVRRNLAAFSSANNHLIVELTSLAVATRVLWGRPDHDALARLESELERQTHRDGVNVEMATHYHMFVLEAVLLVTHLESRHGSKRVRLERIVAAMADYVAALQLEDGHVLHQGDNDDGQLNPLLNIRHAQQLVEASDALTATRSEPSQLEGVFWLTGGRSAAPRATPRASVAFEAAGQIVLRNSIVQAAFNAGPFGFGALAAHAHCDVLAVNVAVEGRRALVDRGTHRYNGSELRDHFRSTEAHNTLQVAGRQQAHAAGPFLWAKRPKSTLVAYQFASNIDIAVGEHDGFSPFVHRRIAARHGSHIVILDLVSENADVTCRHHVAPELIVERHDSVFRLLDASSRTPVAWIYIPVGHCEMRVMPHSDRYGQLQNAPTLEVSTHLRKRSYLAAVIGARLPPVDMRRSADEMIHETLAHAIALAPMQLEALST